eukprot:GHVH01010634.1.p1 GENE.GHVH01010634.1~~GHVH01010634.1.p1  ORF type:complete len:665 (-),score=55.35 GHVH01010634.1:180-2174(-)
MSAIPGVVAISGALTRLLGVVDETSVHEFDPHFNLQVFETLNSEGYAAFENFYDSKAWYPLGRVAGHSTYPGLMMVAEMIHRLLVFCGFHPTSVHAAILVGPLCSLVTTCAVVAMARDLAGRSSSRDVLLSAVAAVLGAFHYANIRKTAAGSFDNEAVAVSGLALFSLFYVRAFRDRNYRDLILAILSFWILQSSWGGFMFVWVIISFFQVIANQLEVVPYSLQTCCMNLLMHSSIILLSQTISVQRHFAIRSGEAFVCHALLIISIIPRRLHVLALPLSLPVVFAFPKISPRAIKILLPWLKTEAGVLATSISEHRPSPWGLIMADHHILTAMAGFSGVMFLCVNYTTMNPKLKLMMMYHVIFISLTGYFGGIMIRLSALSTPSLCAVSAFMLCQSMKGSILSKMMVLPVIGSYVFHGLKMNGMYSTNIVIAEKAQSLDGNFVLIDDYRQTYRYLRSNYPENTRIAMWWDYGYPLNYYSKLSSFNDNNTWDSQQISRIALGFVLPPAESAAVYRAMEVDVVCVVNGGKIKSSGGMLAKLPWINRLAEEGFPKWYQHERLSATVAPSEYFNSTEHQSTTLMTLSYHDPSAIPYDQNLMRESPRYEGPLVYYRSAFKSTHRMLQCYEIDDPFLTANIWRGLRWDFVNQPSLVRDQHDDYADVDEL